MCGKHAAPIFLLLSNWKSQSVVLPSKFSSKHFNLTRYQTAGHATWKVGGQHTMDDWTCHLRQCANILCRTNSRRMLSKVIPTATCFNGTPTYGNHGLTLTVKISKRIGIRKDTLIIPNDRTQPSQQRTSISYSRTHLPITSWEPQWTNLWNVSLPTRNPSETIYWFRHWKLESTKLPSSEGILHKWFIPSLATSQSGTQIKLWNSSSFAVRATWMYIFGMKRLCITIVWKLWVPLALQCLTQCCQ